MTRRFWNVGTDGEIMSAACELDVKLMRFGNGQLAGTFKISGEFGDCLCDDDEATSDPRETMEFAADLMRQFQRARPDGDALGA